MTYLKLKQAMLYNLVFNLGVDSLENALYNTGKQLTLRRHK